MSDFRVHKGVLYPALPSPPSRFAVHKGQLHTVLWSCLPFFVSELLPVDAIDWGSQTFTPSALFTHLQGASGTLEFEADTVNTFDSADLDTDSMAVDDGDRGEATLTLPDRVTWYWRVRPGADVLSATVSRTSTGKKYGLDDFETGDFAILANNWDTAGATGTVAIEAGELSGEASGGGTAYEIWSSGSYSGVGVYCCDMELVAGAHVAFQFCGTDSANCYRLRTNSADAVAIIRRVAGAATVLCSVSVAGVGTGQHSYKVVHDATTGTFSIYVDGVSRITCTDDEQAWSSGLFGLQGFSAVVDTAHGHLDNVALMSANTITCSDLPTGWKLRVGQDDTRKATESGGTATVDLLGLALPVSKVEALDYYSAIRGTYTSAGDVWGGDAYSVATAYSSTEWGAWAPTITVERTSVSIHLSSPATDSDVTTTPQVFQLITRTDDSVQAYVEWETDTVNTFDSGDLVQQTTDPDDDGATHTVNQAYLGNVPWYWRAKAVRDDLGADESAWTTILELTVDTGGVLPTGYDPDPSVDIRIDYMNMTLTVTATVDHVLTPTADATLRLQGQFDTDPGFPAATTETSVRVLGGCPASITFSLGQGDYHFRFRTVADYGDNSAWDTYATTVLLVAYFTAEPHWERHVGSKVNRVLCPIEGTTDYGNALVAGTPAADEVQVWEPVPAMAVLDADAVALTILTHLRARPIAVDGPIPLTNGIELDREITVEYNIRDAAGGDVLDETADVLVARVDHRIVITGEGESAKVDEATHVWLGDYQPSAGDAINRVIAELESKV